MNTELAFTMGELNRGKEEMVFNWDKAAKIIREKQARYAYAGLQHDLEYTGGCIYDDGMPITNEYTFLASTWATPVLILDDEAEEIPCYIMQSKTDWDEKTKWPESSLDILNGKAVYEEEEE